MIPALTALLLGLLLGYRWGWQDQKLQAREEAAFRAMDRLTGTQEPLDRTASERGLW